jgi:regulatory protein
VRPVRASRTKPPPAAATETDPDDEDAAIAAALRILNGASQTELSLLRKLRQRGFGNTAARAAVARMAQLGYIDDDAFAVSVATRRLARGYGRVAVAQELRRRGVGEQPIADSLRGVGFDDERESAIRLAAVLWERELRRCPDDNDRRVRRVAGSLQRRGFPVEAIIHALRSVSSSAGG